KQLDAHLHLHSFPTRRSSDLTQRGRHAARVLSGIELDDIGGDERNAQSLEHRQHFAYREATGLAVRDSRRERGIEGVEVDRDVQDRKSTRLNSSHLGISYAVF